jgi:L-lactate dehydrogenase complex protein LldG
LAENSSNPSRELILERIRAGLRTPVAYPPAEASDDDGVIFAPIPNPLQRFLEECASNLMECMVTSSADESARQLAHTLASLPAGEIYVQDHSTLRQMIGQSSNSHAVRWSSEGAPQEISQATVSLAEALIAQTGSVLVTASNGGRGISVVAPVHIVVATTSQLLPDLQTALAKLTRENKLDSNSFACVISGSSRTADIEKILVQGAHGPIRLIVILQKS